MMHTIVDDSQYEELTRACDALLLAPKATLNRVAVSWLHVLNEHPSNLERYEDLLVPSRLLVANRRAVKQIAGNAITLARSFFCGESCVLPKEQSFQFPDRVDVLFISHLVSAQADPESPDFYFGRLPEELASRGLSSLMAMQNHVPLDEKTVRKRMLRGGRASRIVLPRLFGFLRELRMMLGARQAASDIARVAAMANTSFERAVALEASRQARGGSTIAARRLHGTVTMLCERFRPRAVIVLWEGHAWERLAFHAARKVDPHIRCIGYQHAILFPRAHALKRSLGKEFDPDVILTLGEVTAHALRERGVPALTPIVVYGSHRRIGSGSRRPADALTRCLVVPDGIESECMTLFEFALQCALHLPHFEFVLRTHPILPFTQLARRHVWLRTMPPNVRISNEADISADFSQCNSVLYRGSSTAVHAVLSGARPLYLERHGELGIDPLFALNCWRRNVATPTAFAEVVLADQIMTSEARRKEWEPAREFCDRYVVLPDPDVVRDAINGLTPTAI